MYIKYLSIIRINDIKRGYIFYSLKKVILSKPYFIKTKQNNKKKYLYKYTL